MHKRFIYALCVGLVGVSACIIGPKQDDPAEALPGSDSDAGADTSVASDTGSVDTGVDPATNIPDGATDASSVDAKIDGDPGDATDGDVGDARDAMDGGG